VERISIAHETVLYDITCMKDHRFFAKLKPFLGNFDSFRVGSDLRGAATIQIGENWVPPHPLGNKWQIIDEKVVSLNRLVPNI
jgi:hypothetical protein